MKWFFLNAKRRLRHALSYPGYAATVAFREVTWADERFLARLTGTSASRIRQYLDEPARTPEFMQHLKSQEERFNSTSIESAGLYAKKVLLQYAIIRALRPEIVVETGVANGVSSSHVLLALQRNGKGTLHSIEIGDCTYLPAGYQTGWIVPNWLRERWKVNIGDATKLLPELLKSLRVIDVFIHDSLHTAEQMTFEFETAYPFLRKGGCLIADDALWNDAFVAFARSQEVRDAQVIRGIGVMSK